jgi:hypothetical protein
MKNDPHYEEKLSHLNDLVRLSQIDGEESHMESNFIRSIADRLGLSAADLDRIKRGDENIKFATPGHENQAIEQFHRLIILMGIDKMIYREEVNFCVELGVRMGLNYNAVAEALRKTMRNPAYIMPKDQMQAIFKKYSN